MSFTVGWGGAAPGPPRTTQRLEIAGTGIRGGTWLLDCFFANLATSVVWGALAPLGVWSVNEEWLKQVEEYPRPLVPTVPLMQFQVAPFLAISLAIVVATTAFYAFCWTRFRATPAQRIFSVQVADAKTGRNLSAVKAAARAIALYGVTGVAGVVVAVTVMSVTATLIPADFTAPANDSTAAVHLSALALQAITILIACLGALGWLLALLLTTATSPTRQGFHDRLAGSVVAAEAREPVYWTGPVYSPQWGWPAPPRGYPPAWYRQPWPYPGGLNPPAFHGYSPAPDAMVAAPEADPGTQGKEPQQGNRAGG
jgi:uncharacterized RDD family membrane protein YckC